MKSSRRVLSSMPHQNLHQSILYAWLPKDKMWAPVGIGKMETVEQAMVWWGNRGFCLARVKLCGSCEAKGIQMWARHVRTWHVGPDMFKSYYCEGCLPPKEVQPTRQLIEHKSMLDEVHHVEHIFSEEVKEEPQHVTPETPNALWDSMLTLKKTKERH